jgi:hypothetical protein
MNMSEPFNEAVRLLQRGEKSIEIIASLEDMLGLDKPAWEILAEAGAYLKELQNRAFDEAIDAFKRGESSLDVEKKLRALGFHSWDAMVVSSRAKAKVDAEAQENAPE